MKSRQEWMNELIRRQDNIDPIRRIPNGALFQGTLIKGNLRLNRFQRIGTISLALVSFIFGCFVLIQGIVAVRTGNYSFPILPGLLFLPLSFWFSWRVLRNAVINDPRANRN